jgi:cytochrome P450
VYSIHHSSKYYPDPFSYQPERWLGNAQETRLARAAATPFGLGARICLGRGLAITQTALVMAHVLFTLDFEKVSGPEGKVGEGRPDEEWGRQHVGEFQVRNHLTSNKNGPYLRFRQRA